MSGARPIIAIVGRPNVGKSTLFNRLVKRRMAIVENTPGVTRDRHYADTELHNRAVTIVDTGGFVPDAKKEDPLAEHIRLQAQAAVEECEVVLFVCDGRLGVTAEDQEVAQFLRKQKRPVVLVVNKCDNYQVADTVAGEFHKLGLKDPYPVSAEHNEGIEALIEAALAVLPKVEAPLAPKRELRREFDQGDDRGLEDDEEDDRDDDDDDAEEVDDEADDDEAADEEAPTVPEVVEEEPDRPMRVAIVGRPNVGKSTLVNALLGQKRVIVSPIAGTTRDAIDTEFVYKGKPVVLTDTAGIRRKAAISQKVEHFSVLGAMRAIEDSDVAVLVLDADEPAVEQDLKIAALAESKGRALVVCVNKWDLVKGKVPEETFRDQIKWYMKFVSWAPMVFISAKDGLKVTKVLDLALQLFEQQYFRAGTPLLNKIIDHVTTEHPLPMVGRGRQLRLYYAAQVGTAPPSFAVICNAPKEVPNRYERYVTNYLRETFQLKVPVRLFWRERPGGKKRLERAKRFQARERSRRKN